MTQAERDLFLVTLTRAVPGLPAALVVELAAGLMSHASQIEQARRLFQEGKRLRFCDRLGQLCSQVNDRLPLFDPPALWLTDSWVSIPTRAPRKPGGQR